LGRSVIKKIYIYNLTGPPSYMRSVVDRNVVMRLVHVFQAHLLNTVKKLTLSAINRTETRKYRLVGKNLDSATGAPLSAVIRDRVKGGVNCQIK
jgi:hypothetical protein